MWDGQTDGFSVDRYTELLISHLQAEYYKQAKDILDDDTLMECDGVNGSSEATSVDSKGEHHNM